MTIGERLRTLREAKDLSQGDIEKRTGLFRCYVSRVEGGYTVPMLDTLEKFARALEVPLYQIFYEGEEPAAPPDLSGGSASDDLVWGSSRKEARLLSKFRRLLGRVNEEDRKLLLLVAQRMARHARTRSRRVLRENK